MKQVFLKIMLSTDSSISPESKQMLMIFTFKHRRRRQHRFIDQFLIFIQRVDKLGGKKQIICWKVASAKLDLFDNGSNIPRFVNIIAMYVWIFLWTWFFKNTHDDCLLRSLCYCFIVGSIQNCCYFWNYSIAEFVFAALILFNDVLLIRIHWPFNIFYVWPLTIECSKWTKTYSEFNPNKVR